MGFGRLEARNHAVFGHRHAGGAKQRLGVVFLHGERRGQHAGMAVGNAEDFQEALQGAVLAGPAMQHIERDVGLGGGQRRGDVAVDVDRRDAIAAAGERIGAGLAGAQRDFALGRPAPHQDGDVLGHYFCPCPAGSYNR